MGIVISENQYNAVLLHEGLLGEVELQRVVCGQTLTHLRSPPHTAGTCGVRGGKLGHW